MRARHIKNGIVSVLCVMVWMGAWSGAVAGEGQQNYCHDEASWVGWHQLLANNPADDGIYGLYALRRGLCDMVEAGTIEQARATRIFEAAREDLIGKRIDENNRRKPNL